MKITPIPIPVTAAMIETSRPSDCYTCLIATALREATGLPWHVWTRAAYIEIGPPDPSWVFPPEVLSLRRRFDAGERVEPTVFYLPGRFRKYLPKDFLERKR